MRLNRGATLYLAGALTLSACIDPPGMPVGPHFQRPAQLVGEWIDVRHTSPGDTALWVLRGNGYDGSAHIVAATRSERRYGTWYFSGTFADTAHRALCFAKRIGRDGPTCLTFAIDTTTVDGGERRRLVIRGYQGEHYTGDRTLLEHR
jgi:hypothetical protein